MNKVILQYNIIVISQNDVWGMNGKYKFPVLY